MGGGGSNNSRRSYKQYSEPIKKSSGSLPLFDEEDCITFSLQTRVQNPRTSLSKVVKGETLSIQLEPDGTVVVLNGNGEVCGNIAHPKAPRLITCIKKGNKFSAIAIAISGSVCDVFIKNIKS